MLYPTLGHHQLLTANIPLVKQQVVLTHTIRQAKTPAVLDSWVTDTTAVEIVCPQKFVPTYIFVER
jgi:hypothetical protein